MSHPTIRPASRPRSRSRIRTGLALGVLGTLVLGVTTACGDDSEGGDDGEATTITVATFNEFGYEGLIDEWNETHDDIKLEQVKVGTWDDAKANLYTKLAAGSGLSDIEAIEGDAIAAVLAESDAFTDLTDPALDDRWLDFAVDRGHELGRRADRLRHRRRPGGHLLPRRPVRAGRAADRPRRGGRAPGHLGRLLRHRREVRGRDAGHRVVRLLRRASRRRCSTRSRTRSRPTTTRSTPTTPS